MKFSGTIPLTPLRVISGHAYQKSGEKWIPISNGTISTGRTPDCLGGRAEVEYGIPLLLGPNAILSRKGVKGVPKFSRNAQEALADPTTREKIIELTPERKEKFRSIAKELDVLLRNRTEGPLEAYMVLQFVLQAFEEAFGIRGTITVEDDDYEKGARQ